MTMKLNDREIKLNDMESRFAKVALLYLQSDQVNKEAMNFELLEEIFAFRYKCNYRTY